LRIALLSLMEPVAGEPQGLRGYLSIGGRSVVRHQLGLALAFGCSRIAVLADALTGEVVALQHAAEAAGARFHVIASQRALVPLVSPEDELIVFADGLLAMPDDAMRMLADGPAVLTLPVETALPLGFERIDINNAHAGAMRLPGRLVAGLGDLPSEWNPISALLRIAVQGRVPLKGLPAALLDEGRWRLLRDEEDADRAEPAWLRLHTGSAHPRSVGEWLAAQAVQRFGPALLHAGTRPWLLGVAALILILIGLGAGWFGWIAPAFLLIAIAWLSLVAGRLLARVEAASLLSQRGRVPAESIALLLVDAGLLLLATWKGITPVDAMNVAASATDGSVVAGAFAPLVLLLLLRFLPVVLPERRWSWWLQDRFALGVLLAIAAANLPFAAFVRLSVLFLLVLAMLVTRPVDGPPNPELTSRG